MKRHESRITFADEDKGTRLDYHAEMVPGPIAALVTNPQRVELELREHFEAIAAEILRRQEASPRSLRQGQSPSALHHPVKAPPRRPRLTRLSAQAHRTFA